MGNSFENDLVHELSLDDMFDSNGIKVDISCDVINNSESWQDMSCPQFPRVDSVRKLFAIPDGEGIIYISFEGKRVKFDRDAEECYIVDTEEKLDTVSGRTDKVTHEMREMAAKAGFGEYTQYNNIESVCDNAVLIRDPDQNDYYVLYFKEGRKISLFDYTFGGIIGRLGPDLKNMENYELCDKLYAIDLASHTVVFYDFPELTGRLYQKGSLIQVTKTGMARLNHVYRELKGYRSEPEMHDIRTICRDCRGHELVKKQTVYSSEWQLFYSYPDGTEKKIELCTPYEEMDEGTFTMVDNHTAVFYATSLGTEKIYIIDFAKNKRYAIDVEDMMQ